MQIIFGIKHFTIDSYSKFELGLTNEKTYTGQLFEYRQAYLQVFWIPIIGLGKSWVMYQGGEYYELPDDIRSNMHKATFEKKSVWYRNLGIYLAVIGYFCSLALVKYENYSSEKRDFENNLQTIKSINAYIKKPAVGDHYSFHLVNASFSETGGSSFKTFEVHNFTSDSIQLTVPLPEANGIKIERVNGEIDKEDLKEKIIQLTENRQKMKDSIEQFHPIRERILEELKFNCRIHQLPENEVFRLIWISKKDLLKCVPKTPKQKNSFTGAFLNELNPIYNFKLQIETVQRAEKN